METSITNSLSYLIAQVCKAHRNRGQELLMDVNLHLGQEMVILRLASGDGLTQSQLAEYLSISAVTMTKSLARMEKAGIIERRHDESDQRISRVYLTEKGRQLQEPAESIWRDLDEQTMANFSQEEKIIFRRLLLQVYENLKS